MNLSHKANEWLENTLISFSIICDEEIMNGDERDDLANLLCEEIAFNIPGETPDYWDEYKYGAWRKQQ